MAIFKLCQASVMLLLYCGEKLEIFDKCDACTESVVWSFSNFLSDKTMNFWMELELYGNHMVTQCHSKQRNAA